MRLCLPKIQLTPLPVKGAEDLPKRLFEPLGYQVSVEKHALLPHKPEWGDSDYISLSLTIAEAFTNRVRTFVCADSCLG